MAGLEIELKAGLDRASARQLVRRLNQRTGRSQSATLVATYFDTPDRRLEHAGISLRLRYEGRAWVQAVKWGRTGEGGFHAVQEAESAVAGREPDVAEIKDPMLRSTLEGLLSGETPTPRFTTSVRRRISSVRHAGALVEVALDSGHIEAGALSQPILEAEFELKEGSPEALFELAGELLGDLPVELSLPSKAARGARLAGGDAPEPVAQRPAPPDPHAHAMDSWRASLSILARTIATELHRLLKDDDPEGPHQLRVALRRLRVLERIHRPILDPDVATEIADSARRIGRLVAPLRDSDVLVDMMCSRVQLSPALSRALGAAGSEVRKDVRVRLRADRASAFAIRLLQLANLGGWERNGQPDLIMVGTLLDRQMKRQWKALKRLGDRLSTLDERAQHEFRKTAKRTRYLLELYKPSTEADEFRNRLKKLQEVLGQLNDLHVMGSWAPPVMPVGVRSEFAAAREALVHAASGRADLALGRACRHWRAISGLQRPSAWPAQQLHPEPNH